MTLPLLFHNLPDTAPPLSATSLREKCRSILESLSHLCTQPALFETLVIRILSKLALIPTPSVTSSDGDIDMTASEIRECSVSYVWDLLNCLSGAIDAKLDAKHVDVVKHFDQIVPRLFGLAVNAATPRVGDVEPLFRDRRLSALVGRIAETLTWELDVEYVAPFSEINPLTASDARRGSSQQCMMPFRRGRCRVSFIGQHLRSPHRRLRYE